MAFVLRQKRFNLNQLFFIAILLGLAGILLVVARAANTPTAGPAGTFSNWYFPGTGYNSLEWTFVPVKDPPTSLQQQGLLHYYAYNFSVLNATGTLGGGYAGFQTNGIWAGVSQGKAINFSIWGSNGGNSPTGMVSSANAESGGYQIMLKYPWVEGRHYRFELKNGTSPTDAGGKWWGLWVTDKTTNITTYVGQQRIPTTIGGKPSTTLTGATSMFGEDTHWWRSYNGAIVYNCSDFQNSAMAAIDITANGTVRPSSTSNSTSSGGLYTDPGSGYVTQGCPVTLYTDANKNVQHNLGYWASAAHSYLPNITKPGDLNGDGQVAIQDLSILAKNYNKSNVGILAGDINADAIVGIKDLSIMATNWGI